MNNIATSIENTPPMIQEAIIGETRTIIEKRVRSEIEKKTIVRVEKEIEKKSKKYIGGVYSWLISDMVIDIVHATVNGHNRINYRYKFPLMEQDVIEDAIETAETIANVCVLMRLETGSDNFEAWCTPP
jgi:hypothetical protein